jgi:rhodanese-related sulfurtransferase
MVRLASLKSLPIEHSQAHVDAGACYIDLRSVSEYLDVHILGSICLQYERGPGMYSRARDCIPLDVPFLLLNDGSCDVEEVAAGLRGKGFAVNGALAGGVRAWSESYGTPASTEIITTSDAPSGLVLDVADTRVRRWADAQHLPIENLWTNAGSIEDPEGVVILAGQGVRAVLAVGMFERAGKQNVVFWKRP